MALADQYVTETGTSVFLTGKAGTGKTTFLHYIAEHCPKRNVVVAPTGVAAVNARGVTIHSFFQLPFCPYLPDIPELITEYQMPDQQRQLRKSKIDIIRTLELLIIDEISMVRADLLDAVDATLRRYRRNNRPFGGVQLLMIGDVQQLAPVVTEEERPFLERIYTSPFFFHSKALQKLTYITIQLSTIYRQQDPVFVNLLNNIRDGLFDIQTLDALNTRVRQPESPTNNGNDYPVPILLTTHTYQADAINRERMMSLTTPSFTLDAEIIGNFPESSMPTDKCLELKVGAQVMFIKNDKSGEHLYYNGKIGTVNGIRRETDANGNPVRIVEICDEEGNKINVTPERWEYLRYEIDSKDNQIKQIVDGTFIQYPLKTAWAITIHKAQGLTFDRVAVNVSEAFAYGQVYVALSRCRNLEGLTLTAPITAEAAFNNPDIIQFNNTLTSLKDAENALEGYRKQYYYNLLFELFDFSTIQHEVERIGALFQGALRNIYPSLAQSLAQLMTNEIPNIVSVAERFRRQLTAISLMPDGQSDMLAERIHKAAQYFTEKLSTLEIHLSPLLDISIDNKETKKLYNETSTRITQLMELKTECLSNVLRHGFTVESYLKAKTENTLAGNKKNNHQRHKTTITDCRHPDLVPLITRWRQQKSEERNIPAYVVLQQKAVIGIADKLPSSIAELQMIKGIGNTFIQKYGTEILHIVADFYTKSHIKTYPTQTVIETSTSKEIPQQKEPQKKNTKKIPTWKQAAQLVEGGCSLEETATRLHRAISTIESYMYTAAENEAIDLSILVSPKEQNEIISYLKETHPRGLKPVYEHFKSRYPYYKLRIAALIARKTEE